MANIKKRLVIWYSFVLILLAGVGFYGITHNIWI